MYSKSFLSRAGAASAKIAALLSFIAIPAGGMRGEDAPAEDGKLILSEAFPSGALPDGWEIVTGKWEVKDGALHGVGEGAGAFIRCNKDTGRNVRIEYTAWSEQPCDLSVLLSLDAKVAQPAMNGYLFAFGSYNNTKNSISRIVPGKETSELARSLMEGFSTGITPGVKHRMVMERKDGKLSFYRDGVLELSADDPFHRDISGRSFGFYTWQSGFFSDVKVYALPETEDTSVGQNEIAFRDVSDFQAWGASGLPADLKVTGNPDSTVVIEDNPTWVYTGGNAGHASSKYVSDPNLVLKAKGPAEEKSVCVVKKFEPLENGIVEFDLLADQNSETKVALLSEDGTEVFALVLDAKGRFMAETANGRVSLVNKIEYRRRKLQADLKFVPRKWHTIRLNFDSASGVIRDVALVGLYTEPRVVSIHGYSRGASDQGDYFSLGNNLEFANPGRVAGLSVCVSGDNQVRLDNLCIFGPVGNATVNGKPIVLPARELLGLSFPPRKDPLQLKYQTFRNLTTKQKWYTFMTSDDVRYVEGAGRKPEFYTAGSSYNKLMLRNAFVKEKTDMLDRTAFYLRGNEAGKSLEAGVASLRKSTLESEVLLEQALETYGHAYLADKNATLLAETFDPVAVKLEDSIRKEEQEIDRLLAAIPAEVCLNGAAEIQACPQPLQETPYVWDKEKKWWTLNGKPEAYFYSASQTYVESERLMGLYPHIYRILLDAASPGSGEYIAASSVKTAKDKITAQRNAFGKPLMMPVETDIGKHYVMSMAPTWWLNEHGKDPDIYFSRNDGTPFAEPFAYKTWFSNACSLNFWNPEVQKLNQNMAAALGTALNAFLDAGEISDVKFGHEAQNILNEGQETGHNKSAIAAFQDSLKKRYGSIGALNADWKEAYKSFSDIVPPAARTKPSALQYEFQKFRHRGYFDTFIEPVKKAFLGAFAGNAVLISDFQNTLGATFDMVPYFKTFDMMLFHTYQTWDRTIYGRWLDALAKGTGTPWGTLEVVTSQGLAEMLDLEVIRKHGQREQFYAMMWGARALNFFDNFPVSNWQFGIPFGNYIVGNNLLNYSSSYAAISVDRARRFGEPAITVPTAPPDVAVLEVTDSYYNDYPAGSLRATMQEMVVSLEEERMNYGFLYEDLVVEGKQKLEGLKTILIPNGVCMKPELQAILAAWVKNGGVLISNAPAGALDQYGRPYKGFVTEAFGGGEWTHANYASWTLKDRKPDLQAGTARFYETAFGNGKIIIASSNHWMVIKKKILDNVRKHAPQSIGADSKDIVYCVREDETAKYVYLLNFSLDQDVQSKVFVNGKFREVADAGLQRPILVPAEFQDGKTVFTVSLKPSEGTLIKLVK